jgi:hypothetical protein
MPFQAFFWTHFLKKNSPEVLFAFIILAFRLFNRYCKFGGCVEAVGRGLEPWPKRMSTPPPRLKDLGLNEKAFADNSVISLLQIVLKTRPDHLVTITSWW